MKNDSVIRRSIPLAVMTGLLVLGTGCKNPFCPRRTTGTGPTAGRAPRRSQPAPPPARQDADSQRHPSQDRGGVRVERQNIQVNMANGVATLTGKVDNDASARWRPRTALNRRGEDGGQQPSGRAAQDGEGAATDARKQGSGRECSATASSGRGACSAPRRMQFVPPPPPPPPPPVAKTVTLPAGTVIPIRMTDTLDSAPPSPTRRFMLRWAGT